MKNNLRWIAVLPGALLCVLIVTFPIHWFVGLIQYFCSYSDYPIIAIKGKSLLTTIPPEMFERFGRAFCTPIVMILCGAKIAPKLKFQTGIALVVLWSIFFVGSIIYLILKNGFANLGWLQLSISSALGITGAFLGVYELKRKETALKMASYGKEELG